jgi:inorganic pyrophosphatase
MANYVDLPCRDDDGRYNFVVESPKGSIIKIAYDPQCGAFVFKRALNLGVCYPYDWGFVPSTRAADGDPLDAMLLFDAPSWPGVIFRARTIGVVLLTQKSDGDKRQRNDRIIFVPADERRFDHVNDLPENVRQELEQFFMKVTELRDKRVVIEGWEGPERAVEIIDEAAREYRSTLERAR